MNEYLSLQTTTPDKAVSEEELRATIARARKKGFRIYGPRDDGTYIVWEADQVIAGREVEGQIRCIPSGSFLWQYLQDHPFLHVLVGPPRPVGRPRSVEPLPDLRIV